MTKFDNNGLLTLKYSEDLSPFANLTEVNLNITNYLVLTYTCMGDSEETAYLPQLIAYQVVNSTATALTIKMNFTNPLYVSSFGIRDRLSILMVANHMFFSPVDNFMLAPDYLIVGIQVPPQAKSEEDFLSIQAMGSSASGSMIFTLIVPFCFMLFMSFSMNRVWALYNML